MQTLVIRTLVSAVTLTSMLATGGATAQFVDVAAGGYHTLALRADGQIVAWGDNAFGQCDVPALPAGLTYVEVAAGGANSSSYYFADGFSVARRSDDSVVTWGSAFWVSDPPALPPGLGYTGIAAGLTHALALRSDGTVVAWGDNSSGQCDVPALPPGLTYVEVSAGGSQFDQVDYCSGAGGPGPGDFAWIYGYSVARRSDGSVVAWGSNPAVWAGVPALPPGVTYVEVSAGADHVAARRSDGSVVAWGSNDLGQTDVPAPPPGLAYAGLDAGAGNTTAWLDDGTVVEWGQALATGVGGLAAPPLPPGTTYVDLDVGGAKGVADSWFPAGGPGCWPEPFCNCDVFSGPWATAHVVALRSDGVVVAWGDNGLYQAFDPWTDLGGGTPGSSETPALDGSGTPLEGEVVALKLGGAPSGAAMLAWISFAPVPFAALGGTVHAYPFSSQLPFTAGPFGTFYGSVVWPSGIPSGTRAWFQFLVQDATVPAGITLSNGLELEVP